MSTNTRRRPGDFAVLRQNGETLIVMYQGGETWSLVGIVRPDQAIFPFMNLKDRLVYRYVRFPKPVDPVQEAVALADWIGEHQAEFERFMEHPELAQQLFGHRFADPRLN